MEILKTTQLQTYRDRVIGNRTIRWDVKWARSVCLIFLLSLHSSIVPRTDIFFSPAKGILSVLEMSKRVTRNLFVDSSLSYSQHEHRLLICKLTRNELSFHFFKDKPFFLFLEIYGRKKMNELKIKNWQFPPRLRWHLGRVRWKKKWMRPRTDDNVRFVAAHKIYKARLSSSRCSTELKFPTSGVKEIKTSEYKTM